MASSVPIKPDNEGYIGRECPECEKYFKIKLGTGMEGDGPCHCPYCNHNASLDEFHTEAQFEYAESIVIRDALKSLKRLETKPTRNDLISVTLTVEGGPAPIARYSEKELEEKVKCCNCALEYAIYGIFGYCPDCGIYNSQQILFINFDRIIKMLELAKNEDSDIAKLLIENCLEDSISSFDGYVRECTGKAGKGISFQNIDGANKNLKDNFGLDIFGSLSSDEWQFLTKQFQKRHLLSHKMGVIDNDYIQKTNGDTAAIGRKVKVNPEDVVKLIAILRKISDGIHSVVK